MRALIAMSGGVDSSVAALLAMEFNAMLPAGSIPAHTEGYQGFFHLTDMSGTEETAQLRYIIRDHDLEKFQQKKDHKG